MAVTGRYDFKGIKKFGARGLALALASTTPGSWLLKSVLAPATTIALEWFSNWLANRGLVVLNIGATFYDEHFDQKAFDKAIQDGLAQLELPEGRAKLTPAQGKAIDEAVKTAFRDFAPVSR